MESEEGRELKMRVEAHKEGAAAACNEELALHPLFVTVTVKVSSDYNPLFVIEARKMNLIEERKESSDILVKNVEWNIKKICPNFFFE